jgi:hypothetical protein
VGTLFLMLLTIVSISLPKSAPWLVYLPVCPKETEKIQIANKQKKEPFKQIQPQHHIILPHPCCCCTKYRNTNYKTMSKKIIQKQVTGMITYHSRIRQGWSHQFKANGMISNRFIHPLHNYK